MGSQSAFLTSGMSSSSLDGGLTKSLLDSASLSASLDDSSSLLGWQKTLTTTGASDPISSLIRQPFNKRHHNQWQQQFRL